MKTFFTLILLSLSSTALADKCCVPNEQLPDDLYEIAQDFCAHPYLNEGHPQDAATPGNYYHGEQRCISANYGGGQYYFCNWNYSDIDCQANRPVDSGGKPNQVKLSK